jgi:hypothetical protein
MFTSGLIFWYSTRQASINGNGKLAPAPLSSILCSATEFPKGMQMTVKNADNNNNINKPARIVKFCVLVRFSDIDYSSSHEEEVFMATPHDLHVLYSEIRNQSKKWKGE